MDYFHDIFLLKIAFVLINNLILVVPIMINSYYTSYYEDKCGR